MKEEPYNKVREVKNLKNLIEESSELYSEKTAYYVKKNSKKYSEIKFKQVKKDMDALGTSLINLGLKNERIAIIGENRYEWAISYLAIINGTGVVVPLDRQLPANEIKSCLERARVTGIIYSNVVEEKINSIKENLKNVKIYINMDIRDNILSLEKLIKKGNELINEGNTSFINAEIDINVMSELLFTSGTTAESKAVMLSHKNICFNIYQQCKMLKIKEDDVFLSMLPIHHVYECVCGFLTPFYRGAAVAYCEGLRHIQKNMQEAHISVFLSVPLVFETLYRKLWEGIEKKGKTKTVKKMIKITNKLDKCGIHIKRIVFKSIHEQFGGKVRLFIAGAAAVNPQVLQGFRDIGIFTVQGYGLTECAPIVALNRDLNYKDDAVGLPLVGTQIKIDNPNSEGIGEILIKGDHVMLGYYENEEKTKNVIKDNWFYSGDLGYLDNDGFLHISGRKKNVIITKNGKNVYPEEIETLLNENEYIKESMVYAKKQKNDIIVVADIILDNEYLEEKYKSDGKSKDELKEIIWKEIKNINQTMVTYKHIKEINIREKEFEKTTTMKIKRYLEVEN